MMQSMKSVTCLIVLMAFVGFAGCQQGSKGTTGQTVSALVGEWTLESIEGSDVAKTLPDRSRRPNIAIAADGKMSGFGGVNRVSSALDVAAVPKGEFKLGPIISTKMAGPPEAMEVEGRFTRLLGEAASFELAGDTLTLWNAQKGPAMKLVRAR